MTTVTGNEPNTSSVGVQSEGLESLDDYRVALEFAEKHGYGLVEFVDVSKEHTSPRKWKNARTYTKIGDQFTFGREERIFSIKYASNKNKDMRWQNRRKCESRPPPLHQVDTDFDFGTDEDVTTDTTDVSSVRNVLAPRVLSPPSNQRNKRRQFVGKVKEYVNDTKKGAGASSGGIQYNQQPTTSVAYNRFISDEDLQFSSFSNYKQKVIEMCQRISSNEANKQSEENGTIETTSDETDVKKDDRVDRAYVANNNNYTANDFKHNDTFQTASSTMGIVPGEKSVERSNTLKRERIQKIHYKASNDEKCENNGFLSDEGNIESSEENIKSNGHETYVQEEGKDEETEGRVVGEQMGLGKKTECIRKCINRDKPSTGSAFRKRCISRPVRRMIDIGVESEGLASRMTRLSVERSGVVSCSNLTNDTRVNDICTITTHGPKTVAGDPSDTSAQGDCIPTQEGKDYCSKTNDILQKPYQANGCRDDLNQVDDPDPFACQADQGKQRTDHLYEKNNNKLCANREECSRLTYFEKIESTKTIVNKNTLPFHGETNVEKQVRPGRDVNDIIKESNVGSVASFDFGKVIVSDSFDMSNQEGRLDEESKAKHKADCLHSDISTTLCEATIDFEDKTLLVPKTAWPLVGTREKDRDSAIVPQNGEYGCFGLKKSNPTNSCSIFNDIRGDDHKKHVMVDGKGLDDADSNNNALGNDLTDSSQSSISVVGVFNAVPGHRGQQDMPGVIQSHEDSIGFELENELIRMVRDQRVIDDNNTKCGYCNRHRISSTLSYNCPHCYDQNSSKSILAQNRTKRVGISSKRPSVSFGLTSRYYPMMSPDASNQGTTTCNNDTDNSTRVVDNNMVVQSQSPPTAIKQEECAHNQQTHSTICNIVTTPRPDFHLNGFQQGIDYCPTTENYWNTSTITTPTLANAFNTHCHTELAHALPTNFIGEQHHCDMSVDDEVNKVNTTQQIHDTSDYYRHIDASIAHSQDILGKRLENIDREVNERLNSLEQFVRNRLNNTNKKIGKLKKANKITTTQKLVENYNESTSSAIHLNTEAAAQTSQVNGYEVQNETNKLSAQETTDKGKNSFPCISFNELTFENTEEGPPPTHSENRKRHSESSELRQTANYPRQIIGRQYDLDKTKKEICKSSKAPKNSVKLSPCCPKYSYRPQMHSRRCRLRMHTGGDKSCNMCLTKRGNRFEQSYARIPPTRRPRKTYVNRTRQRQDTFPNRRLQCQARTSTMTRRSRKQSTISMNKRRKKSRSILANKRRGKSPATVSKDKRKSQKQTTILKNKKRQKGRATTSTRKRKYWKQTNISTNKRRRKSRASSTKKRSSKRRTASSKKGISKSRDKKRRNSQVRKYIRVRKLRIQRNNYSCVCQKNRKKVSNRIENGGRRFYVFKDKSNSCLSTKKKRKTTGRKTCSTNSLCNPDNRLKFDQEMFQLTAAGYRYVSTRLLRERRSLLNKLASPRRLCDGVLTIVDKKRHTVNKFKQLVSHSSNARVNRLFRIVCLGEERVPNSNAINYAINRSVERRSRLQISDEENNNYNTEDTTNHVLSSKVKRTRKFDELLNKEHNHDQLNFLHHVDSLRLIRNDKACNFMGKQSSCFFKQPRTYQPDRDRDFVVTENDRTQLDMRDPFHSNCNSNTSMTYSKSSLIPHQSKNAFGSFCSNICIQQQINEVNNSTRRNSFELTTIKCNECENYIATDAVTHCLKCVGNKSDGHENKNRSLCPSIVDAQYSLTPVCLDSSSYDNNSQAEICQWSITETDKRNIPTFRWTNPEVVHSSERNNHFEEIDSTTETDMVIQDTSSSLKNPHSEIISKDTSPTEAMGTFSPNKEANLSVSDEITGRLIKDHNREYHLRKLPTLVLRPKISDQTQSTDNDAVNNINGEDHSNVSRGETTNDVQFLSMSSRGDTDNQDSCNNHMESLKLQEKEASITLSINHSQLHASMAFAGDPGKTSAKHGDASSLFLNESLDDADRSTVSNREPSGPRNRMSFKEPEENPCEIKCCLCLYKATTTPTPNDSINIDDLPANGTLNLVQNSDILQENQSRNQLNSAQNSTRVGPNSSTSSITGSLGLPSRKLDAVVAGVDNVMSDDVTNKNNQSAEVSKLRASVNILYDFEDDSVICTNELDTSISKSDIELLCEGDELIHCQQEDRRVEKHSPDIEQSIVERKSDVDNEYSQIPDSSIVLSTLTVPDHCFDEKIFDALSSTPPAITDTMLFKGCHVGKYKEKDNTALPDVAQGTNTALEDNINYFESFDVKTSDTNNINSTTDVASIAQTNDTGRYEMMSVSVDDDFLSGIGTDNACNKTPSVKSISCLQDHVNDRDINDAMEVGNDTAEGVQPLDTPISDGHIQNIYEWEGLLEKFSSDMDVGQDVDHEEGDNTLLDFNYRATSNNSFCHSALQSHIDRESDRLESSPDCANTESRDNWEDNIPNNSTAQSERSHYEFNTILVEPGGTALFQDSVICSNDVLLEKHVTFDDTLENHVTHGSILDKDVTCENTGEDHVMCGNIVKDHVTCDSHMNDHVNCDSILDGLAICENTGKDHVACGNILEDHVTCGSILKNHDTFHNILQDNIISDSILEDHVACDSILEDLTSCDNVLDNSGIIETINVHGPCQNISDVNGEIRDIAQRHEVPGHTAIPDYTSESETTEGTMQPLQQAVGFPITLPHLKVNVPGLSTKWTVTVWPRPPSSPSNGNETLESERTQTNETLTNRLEIPEMDNDHVSEGNPGGADSPLSSANASHSENQSNSIAPLGQQQSSPIFTSPSETTNNNNLTLTPSPLYSLQQNCLPTLLLRSVLNNNETTTVPTGFDNSNIFCSPQQDSLLTLLLRPVWDNDTCPETTSIVSTISGHFDNPPSCNFDTANVTSCGSNGTDPTTSRNRLSGPSTQERSEQRGLNDYVDQVSRPTLGKRKRSVSCQYDKISPRPGKLPRTCCPSNFDQCMLCRRSSFIPRRRRWQLMRELRLFDQSRLHPQRRPHFIVQRPLPPVDGPSSDADSESSV